MLINKVKEILTNNKIEERIIIGGLLDENSVGLFATAGQPSLMYFDNSRLDRNGLQVVVRNKSYEKGFKMDIPEDIKDNVYVAGAVIKDGSLLTNGGRVLGATATDDNLEGAINKAYGLVSKIKFDNAYYRNDIGKKALMAKGEK
jgi:phosphoribosylamine-glycine ligase